MQVDIKEFIRQAGLDEPLYPGKRVVKPCPQPGDHKSHCVVYDWRDADKIRIEIKAGLSGRDLTPRELVLYPISFQAPTFIEIDVKTGIMRTVEAEDGDEGETGKASGDGKRPATRNRATRMFSSAAEGALPEKGRIAAMVVLGMRIAEEAYDKVAGKFFSQVQHAKIVATDLVAAAGSLLTRYTPASYMKPSGNEDQVYRYNRERNEPMFVGVMPG
jgi:hypothetical protein